MPLLTSPIDGSPMRQMKRFGIEIDVCPTSGGIWLDKGELEKLMHFIREEANQTSSYRDGHEDGDDDWYGSGSDRSYSRRSDRRDDRGRRRDGGERESKLEMLLDFFDFD